MTFRNSSWATAARQAILNRLQERQDHWIDGEELESVGGQLDGLRRMRELRDEGYAIERRPNAAKGGRWQYRLSSTSGEQLGLWRSDDW